MKSKREKEKLSLFFNAWDGCLKNEWGIYEHRVLNTSLNLSVLTSKVYGLVLVSRKV